MRRLRVFPFTNEDAFENQVIRQSSQADLTIVGFDKADISNRGKEIFSAYPGVHDLLFVHAGHEIAIT